MCCFSAQCSSLLQPIFFLPGHRWSEGVVASHSKDDKDQCQDGEGDSEQPLGLDATSPGPLVILCAPVNAANEQRCGLAGYQHGFFAAGCGPCVLLVKLLVGAYQQRVFDRLCLSAV